MIENLVIKAEKGNCSLEEEFLQSYMYCSKIIFYSGSRHQEEVQQNDERRERNFRIRRHLSVDGSEQTSNNSTGASLVCCNLFNIITYF